MIKNNYDLIVIGSGPAGEKAAVKAAYFKKKVALVEQQPRFGGAGVHTGTLPSKTLKETALFYSGQMGDRLYQANGYLQASATIERFMYRKNMVTEQLNSEVHRNIVLHGVDIYQGKARFIDKHSVQVAGEPDITLTGDYIIIATGSYPYHPEHIPFDGTIVHDSDSILALDRLPGSLVIVGAGVIGCEYATIFSAIGCKVTLVNGSADIMPFLDREMVCELQRTMQDSGITLLMNKNLADVQIDKGGREVRVSFLEGGSARFDMFLYAAGRCANTADLECGRAGVDLGKREVVLVNQQYQTSQPNIYAVGDVIGFPSLASTGMDQGRAAVSHIFGINDLPAISQELPYGIYTIPEVSMVGLTEEAARKAGIAFAVGRARYTDMPRGKIMGVTNGMLKLLFERDSQTLLGVHIIGALASEIIHFGMLLVQERKSLHDILTAVFNYPTLHDLYKYATYDGLGNLRGYKVKL